MYAVTAAPLRELGRWGPLDRKMVNEAEQRKWDSLRCKPGEFPDSKTRGGARALSSETPLDTTIVASESKPQTVYAAWCCPPGSTTAILYYDPRVAEIGAPVKSKK